MIGFFDWSEEVEPEVLIGDGLLVPRLDETSSKFQEVDLENYRCLASGSVEVVFMKELF